MPFLHKPRLLHVITSLFLATVGVLLLLAFSATPVSAENRAPAGQACVKVKFAHVLAANEIIELSIKADPGDAGAGAAGSLAGTAVGNSTYFTETGLVAQSGTTTDTGVYCTDTVVYDATYTMTAKSPDTLRMRDGSVTTNFGGAAFAPLFTGILKEGDINNDNTISILDVGLLIPSYEKPSGDGDYNANADLNEDTNVNILDVGLLIPNYEQSGVRAPSAPNACGAVTLTLSDATLDPNEAGSLVIGFTGGDIEAFAIDLSYDSSYLTLSNPSSPATISGFSQLKNTSSGNTIEVDGFSFSAVSPSANFIEIPFTNGNNPAASSSAFQVTGVTITCGGAPRSVDSSDTGTVTTSSQLAVSLAAQETSTSSSFALIVLATLLLVGISAETIRRS